MWKTLEKHPTWHDDGKRVRMVDLMGEEEFGTLAMDEGGDGETNIVSIEADNGKTYSFYDFEEWEFV